MEFETLAIHAGQEPDPRTGAVMTPIYPDVDLRPGRRGQSTRRLRVLAYEESHALGAWRTCLAALEGSAYGLAFASGMAATDTVLRLLDSGDHVVAGNDVYGGTYRLFDKVLRRYGLDFTFVDTTDPENVAEAMTSRTRLVWLETPTNPLLAVSDIRAVADIVHAHSPRAPCWLWTTPLPPPTFSGRWNWAPISWCTPRPSTLAVIQMLLAAR